MAPLSTVVAVVGSLLLLLIIGVSIFLSKASKVTQAERFKRLRVLENMLDRVDPVKAQKLPAPKCEACKGKGWIESRSGSMARRTCDCRSTHNWLKFLAAQWTKQGDIKHAAELLLFLKEKL